MSALCQKQTLAKLSLDHLAGELLQTQRYLEAKHLGDLEMTKNSNLVGCLPEARSHDPRA
jgi:hypothetical protein